MWQGCIFYFRNESLMGVEIDSNQRNYQPKPEWPFLQFVEKKAVLPTGPFFTDFSP